VARRGLSAGLIALALAAAATAAAQAGTVRSAVERVDVSSGDWVEFRGTSIQCLVFGPVAAVKGKNGILCFKGRPGEREANTIWVSFTPTTFAIAQAARQPPFLAISRATDRKRVVRVPLDSSLRLTHTRFTKDGEPGYVFCVFASGGRILPRQATPAGEKAVLCVRAGQAGPLPQSTAFFMTQRRAGIVDFGSTPSRLKVAFARAQPRCSCDR